MKTAEMRRAATEVSGLMKVLSNESRLMILCLLAEGEKSVSALARALDMRDSTVSQQLTLLRKDGLVRTRREAQTIHYSLARPDVRRLMEFLYAAYCGDAAREDPGGATDGGGDTA